MCRTDINPDIVPHIMASDDFVDSVMDYLDIDDRDGFVSRLAREVDDERLVSIVRDVFVGRLRSKDDPVDVIRSAMESVVIGLAEDMEYEDDFDPMGADTVGYEMVGIAEAFRDIDVSEDLGFDDSAT